MAQSSQCTEEFDILLEKIPGVPAGVPPENFKEINRKSLQIRSTLPANQQQP